MNSRERILDSVLYLEKHEKSEGAQADAAALRELDQWIIDAVKFLDTLAPTAYPIWQDIRERARKAGY